MAPTFPRIRQDVVHTEGAAIDDSLLPSDHDANAVTIADSISFICSQILRILGPTASKWFDAVPASLSVLAAKLAGHVVQDEGSDLPQRPNLDFVGAGVVASDDPGNDATRISIAAGSLPSANDVGEVLLSIDGSTLEVRQPITTEEGWLVNDEGTLLAVGC